MALLEVNNLNVSLETSHGPARAVRNLNFSLEKGKTLGIVGESGCGKSMTALALMGLLPDNGSTTGDIKLNSENLLEKSEKEMCRIRGNRLAMIFQEPMTSLNPVHTIGKQIMEPLQLHKGLGKKEAFQEAIQLLERVGIPNPSERVKSYPHQLSGGQRQRVMIALALSCSPDILIADEPTTALDVTVQAQIMDVLSDIRREFGTAIILITHDLGVVAGFCDRTLVMYGGKIMEDGPTDHVFADPSHPYTKGLLRAVPRLDRADGKLATIAGEPPDMSNLPTGCPFSPRCAQVQNTCAALPPVLEPHGTDRRRACHLPIAEVA